MPPAIHTRTRILPGKRVEFLAPDFEVGDDVEVFLIQSESREGRSALHIIESLSGHRIHQDAAAISAELIEERDAWDR